MSTQSKPKTYVYHQISSLSILVCYPWWTRIAVEILLGSRVAWGFAYVTLTETNVWGEASSQLDSAILESVLTGICIEAFCPYFFCRFGEFEVKYPLIFVKYSSKKVLREQ